MSEDVRKLLCGKCHVAVETRVDDHGDGTVTCPTCGETDTLDNTTAEAAKDLLVKSLGGALRSGIKPGGPITIKETPQPRARYVFSD